MQSAVSRTAVDALRCKRSAGASVEGYQASEGVRRQSPLVNQFYWLRSKVVHHAVKAAIGEVSSDKEGAPQLLLLGGGLDCSYEAEFPSCRAFVVDVPEVLARRGPPLANSTFVKGDLRDMPAILRSLASLGFDFQRRTVVLAESVLSYLPRKACKQALVAIAEALASPILITFDPLLDLSSDRRDGLSHTLSAEFHKRSATLHTVFPSEVEMYGHLHECRWTHAVCLTMYQYMMVYLSEEDRCIDIYQEPFDEHTDLVLLLQRYVLGIASTSAGIQRDVWQRLATSPTASASCARSHRALALELRVRMAEAKLLSLSSRLPPLPRATIRLARKEDVEVLKSLYLKIFAEYAAKDASVSKYIRSASKKLAQAVEHCSETSHSQVLLAQQGDQIVGCIAVKPSGKPGGDHEGGTMEVTHFCVDQPCRRRKIGSQLLDKAIAQCRALPSVRSVELSVLDKLEAARSLYQRHGFLQGEEQVLTPTCTIFHYVLPLESK